VILVFLIISLYFGVNVAMEIKVVYNKDKLILVNNDCFGFMEELVRRGVRVDAVITSPPYNSNKKAGKHSTNQNTKVNGYSYIRYDVHVDNFTPEEYAEWTANLFNHYDSILAPNGVVLYNLSYGSENTEDWVKALNGVFTQTNFTMADRLVWKKKTAFPISSSPNKMTRIVEDIFVICRRSEMITFRSNKRCTSVRDTGQKAYENVYNFIEAANNDSSCHLNKATFSSELVKKLIDMYVQPNSLVFDSFCGTGTTLVACKHKGLRGIGCELSAAQCEWAKNRLDATKTEQGEKLTEAVAQSAERRTVDAENTGS
jgi:DNA modification methylase